MIKKVLLGLCLSLSLAAGACGEDEDQLCGEIFRAAPEGRKRYHHADRGRHGSSILLDDPANWRPVEEFLEQFRK